MTALHHQKQIINFLQLRLAIVALGMSSNMTTQLNFPCTFKKPEKVTHYKNVHSHYRA